VTEALSGMTIPGKDAVASPHQRAMARGRSVQLDVIRAAAILLVIGAHLTIATPVGIVGLIAGIWHEWGGFGVPLFFTLSGYLVGGLLISELRRRGSIDITRFLIRRGLKIYPAYFVFLAYLVAMPTLKATVTLPTLFSDYWPNVVFLQNYIGPNPAGHTWSLAVEEHFYLTLPFLLLAFIRLRLWRWIALLCLLAPLVGTLARMISAALGDPYIHNFPSTMAATHLCVDGLLVGVGVRALAEFSPDRFASLHAWRWPLLVAGLAIAAVAALPMSTFMGVPLLRILPITATSATALLIGVLHLRLAGWGPSAVAWIGKYSYGIYLWHVTIIGFVGHFIATWPGEGQIAHWVIAATLTTAAAVLFGAFMSHLVEWPVLALRDRLFPSRSA
jgi:peptidoglycan/LPS O-acetylase OafA/YrhL